MTSKHDVETHIGRALIAGRVADGGSVTLDVEDGELIVRLGDSAGAEARPSEEAAASM